MRVFRKLSLILTLILILITLVPQVNLAAEEDIPGTFSIRDSEVK